MSTTKVAAAFLLAAAMTLTGCNSTKKTDTTTRPAGSMGVMPVNKTCPISGEPVNNAETINYKGQTVGFCCGGCAGKFQALSDADKASKLAATTKAR